MSEETASAGPDGRGTRRSFEAGHRPKFLVVVDDTVECSRAVHFAARRSARVGASLLMLAIVEEPEDFEWLGVGEAVIADATAEAETRLAEAVAAARKAAGIEAETLNGVRDVVGLLRT